MRRSERLHTLIGAQLTGVPPKLSTSLSDDYEDFKDAYTGPLGSTTLYEQLLHKSDSQKSAPEAARAETVNVKAQRESNKTQGDTVEAQSFEEAKEQCIVS